MTAEKFTFQAEVSKLLDIVAHSLYSHKEIFLRELISNAADACDRLRYEALTRPELIDGPDGFRITLEVDRKARTLTVADNGVGMTRDELAGNLGTIARSGTQAFVQQMHDTDGDGKGKGKAKKEDKEGAEDAALIGQFGVGFYSAFMVASKVSVVSRRAGEAAAWAWESDGRGEFTIEGAVREGTGTSVTLHMNKGEDEYLDAARLRNIVTKYSDHVGVPIVLLEEGDDGKEETLNAAAALWTRPAREIKPEQYTEFYHHAGHLFDEPWKVLHNRIEGVLSYTSLLFIPSARPFDLFDPDRKPRVKLYVKRVFITDDCEALLPSYLRFVRGVVDSEDLSLNISREMLQHDPKLAKIKNGLVKRILDTLKKSAEKDADDYAKFWENFGAVLKEGLYEDFGSRERLLPLCRFRGIGSDDWISLDAYVDAMKEGQEAIYFITGEDAGQLGRSPHLEGFRARGIDVLRLTDPIDEFWVPALGTYRDKPFKSVTQGAADLDKIPLKDEAKYAEAEKKADAPAIDPLIAALKVALGDAVKDVRASTRLTDSPVCLIADEGDMDMHLERLLRQARRVAPEAATARILEVNPHHPLIERLAESVKDSGAAGADAIDDAAHLLLDQARILEGEPVADPAEFARRLSLVMEKGIGG